MPQAILRLFRATPEFQALLLTIDEFHVFGEVKWLKLDVIKGQSTQLGIAARQIQHLARALHFFEAVRAEARRIRLEMGQRAYLEAAAGVGNTRALGPVGGALGGSRPSPSATVPASRPPAPAPGPPPGRRVAVPARLEPAPSTAPGWFSASGGGCTTGGTTTGPRRAPKPRETPPSAGL